ncbi:hypothetical protein [Paraburkholderia caffeinilytica]|uniref:hypothetical protein n=1 Tax=Paraburkholderia caffeinilytica TaxID=1761016 RepID=UPI003DA0AE48
MFPTDGTETRGEWLFRHQLTLYGSRFLAMWRNVDPEDLKRSWTQRLSGLSPEALRAGIEALAGVTHPPMLPEFLELCRESRAQNAAYDLPRLPFPTAPVTPEVAEANLARMRAIAAAMLRNSRPSPKWAFGFLDKVAKLGRIPGPHDARKNALDAVASSAGSAYIANATDEQRGRWRAALAIIGCAAGLIPSRVPGEDDEPVEAGVQHDPV